jgi:hypothetical protein
VKLSLSINISQKIVPLDPLNVHLYRFDSSNVVFVGNIDAGKEEAFSELNAIIVTGMLRKYVFCCCLVHELKCRIFESINV